MSLFKFVDDAGDGKLEAVQTFLSINKGDIDKSKDRNGTALFASSGKDHLHIVEYLLQQDANPNILNYVST